MKGRDPCRPNGRLGQPHNCAEIYQSVAYVVVSVRCGGSSISMSASGIEFERQGGIPNNIL